MPLNITSLRNIGILLNLTSIQKSSIGFTDPEGTKRGGNPNKVAGGGDSAGKISRKLTSLNLIFIFKREHDCRLVTAMAG
jgi:hypothetical protein